MSGWTKGSLFAARRQPEWLRFGLGAGADRVPRWRIRIRLPLPAIQGLSRRPRPPGPAGGTSCRGPRCGAGPDTVHRHAPFGPPRFAPANGATVGVAQPIIINFPGLVDDAGATESAIHVSSVPPVPGKFYWKTPTQLRWRPLSFWPAHTAVTVDAGGTVSSFRTGDTLVATADDATHQLTVTRNGTVEKTIPMSIGMSAGGHQSANGTYDVQVRCPRWRWIIDLGAPVNSTYGYRVTVDLCPVRRQRQLHTQRSMVCRGPG